MKRYQKYIYIILSIGVLLAIIIMLLVHTFNNTEVDGTTTEEETTKFIIRGE